MPAVLKEPEAEVASVTKQAADSLGFVVVIYMELSAARKIVVAYQARSVLI